MNRYRRRHPYMSYNPRPMYYPCPYMHPLYEMNHPYYAITPAVAHEPLNNPTSIFDEGKQPLVIDIEDATEENTTFRTALWTGDYLQVTLMSIDVGDDIGLELHPDVDQFLRIEEGEGLVQMGVDERHLTFQRHASEDDAIMVPAGMWHNITNVGKKPLKLYSIYAPPEHPQGTVHRTKSEALASEHE